jgi:endonuclease-3
VDWPEIRARLEYAHGPGQWPRTLSALDELISTILSQATSDRNRDRAFKSLRERFPTWREVALAQPGQVVAAIHCGGLAPTKAPRIQEVLRRVRGSYGDYLLPETIPAEELFSFLLTLPGVGPKTARIVMLFSRGEPRFPVDTHIHRVGRRLGLFPFRASPTQAMEQLEKNIPAGMQQALHLLLIEHGRRTCRPRPNCESCVLADRCPSRGVAVRTG